MNVIDQCPEANALVRQIPKAETLAGAMRLRKRYADEFGAELLKVVATLERDWERMVTFYRYPKEHWLHLRASNVVESTFSYIRLPTDAARVTRRSPIRPPRSVS